MCGEIALIREKTLPAGWKKVTLSGVLPVRGALGGAIRAQWDRFKHPQPRGGFRPPRGFVIVRERDVSTFLHGPDANLGIRCGRFRRRPFEGRVGMLEHLGPGRLDPQGIGNWQLVQEGTHRLQECRRKRVLILGRQRGNETDFHKPSNFCNPRSSSQVPNFTNVFFLGHSR